MHNFFSRGEGKGVMFRAQWLHTSMIVALAWVMPASPNQTTFAQDQAAAHNDESKKTKSKFSAEIVAKAEAILKDKGLRRSGKVIQSQETSEISRGLASLNRQRRDLKLVQEKWKTLEARRNQIRLEIRKLNAQDADLNLNLANVAGLDTSANNRLVGLINATRAKLRLLLDQQKELEKPLSDQRGELNQLESDYAEKVLAIRKDYQTLHAKISKVLKDEKVKIAINVMHTNFGSPASVAADKVLLALDKRIERVEKEVFSEKIALDVQGGSMYVNVTVGGKATRMVVDSGASLVSLPAATATKLGIVVPQGARKLKLIMADGRSIDGHKVTLARVRVGEFEAENVEAAILEGTALNAEPLLGMSFLGNFKFSLDRDERTLKITQVATD